MKTVILIRFGIPTVLPKERQLFDEICGETRVGIAGQLGKIGIIAGFKTKLSPHEIATMYEELADSTQDQLPVIVVYPDEVGLNFKDFGFDHFMQAFHQACAEADADAEEAADPQPEAEPTIKCTLSLDDLLDKISAIGTKNLTQAEHERLQELTKNLH